MTPVFNFKKATAEAKRDYPDETKKVTFINLSAPFPRLRLWWWLLRTSKEFRDYINEDKEGLWAFTKTMLSYRCFAVKDPISGHGLLAMVPQTAAWPFNNSHFTFNHELGHLVIAGATLEKLAPQKENDEWDDLAIKNKYETKADTFGTLRSLRQNVITLEEAMNIARNRAIDTWGERTLAHSTTVAIDSVIAYVGDAKLSLTPQELKAITNDHAEKCALSAPALFKLNEKMKLPPQKMLDIIAASNATPCETHISAHVLASILSAPALDNTFNGISADTRLQLAHHLKAKGLDQVIRLSA